MKKIIKKAVSFLLATALAFSFTSAAFAFNGIMPLDKGYSEGTVTLNGVDYVASFYLGGSIEEGKGGYSGFTTNARCVRNHHTVSVAFTTDSGGTQKFSGGEKSWRGEYENYLGKYLGVVGTSTSDYVTCTSGATPTGIVAISGTLTATTVNQDGRTASFDFSASVS